MRAHRRYQSLALWLSLPIILLALAGCRGGGRNPGDTIAKVGDTIITRGVFEERFQHLVPGNSDEHGTAELKNLKIDILDQMIEDELLLQEGERRGVVVSEGELSHEVATLKGDDMDDTFEATIKGRYGTLQRWKSEVRRKLIIRKVMSATVEEPSPVSEKETRAYYEEHNDEFNRSEQVKARMIVVQSEEEAQAIRERLKRERFADVAREVSIGPEGERGGDLGFFERGEMPAEFEEIVFSLPRKKISNVIKTPYGYHIFLVEERKKGVRLPFKEVKEMITDRIQEERRDALLKRRLRELREGTTITIEEALL